MSDKSFRRFMRSFEKEVWQREFAKNFRIWMLSFLLKCMAKKFVFLISVLF